MATRWRIDRALLAPKAYYFCFYAASAGLIPFLVLYYRTAGLTGAQIGLLTGVSPFITWLSAPLWGSVADATNHHRALLSAGILGAIVAMIALSQASTLLWMLPIIVLYAFFSAPIMPLVDNSVMAQLGERNELYGRQRVWGAIGWGLAGAVAGVLVQRYGLFFSFITYVVFMAIGLLVSLRLKVAPGTIGQPFWKGMKTLLANRALVIFLVTVLFASMGSAMVHNFLFLYLEDLGASESLMGLSLTVATLSEMPVFFFSAWFLRKLGARGLLLLAMGAYVVRLLAYTVMPSVWYVLPINLLHGLTFSGLWVAGVSYANRAAPKGLGATAQGLFSGTTMGLGAASGALLGGALYDSLGPATMYRAAAVWVAIGFVFFLLVGRRARDVQAEVQ